MSKQLLKQINDAVFEQNIYTVSLSDVMGMLATNFDEHTMESIKLKHMFVKDFGYEFVKQSSRVNSEVEEKMWSVFILNYKLYRVEYWSDSYSENDYSNICNSFKEVVPVEKLVTVYE